MEKIKLTQFSHGAGCGCKIAPDLLEQILQHNPNSLTFPGLLVGNSTKDDAAVFDLGNGEAIISTTDFFMPIVDDPEDFGGIASVNAISDIYAMGGTPLMAIAILGWPVDKLSPDIAALVLKGSRTACESAGIPLAGGHSIDAPEPIFGLAVTGRIKTGQIKKNDGALPGSLLYLTKPIGVGIVTTAQKKGIVRDEDLKVVRDSMLTLNKTGEMLAGLSYVNALTDVTGFGLLGHLVEMCEGSGVSAMIDFEKVPKFSFLEPYIAGKCFPGGTKRNLRSYGHKILAENTDWLDILADPQTSGGLLISVDSAFRQEFESVMSKQGMNLWPFGELQTPAEDIPLIRIS
ncbi:selenide, water dikinase SelD [Fulvivirga sedimenti]|uniref:Selenide, water dikinase n=1 Tax=Fulvivirga sedimenti TaxID=2879465 RepID=A0A9X1HRX1_9BACT|nr:selenide, water dikinase SelD [Fulvivirga sedimenti]MCA6074686.1 selenide, water dikinase SelD [Fulvivirga sedimenti]MCA6075863.1 selenide, water dikinase SelD [Fulvivirga sedimenti]MCA6076991.1 selenide, water dikinase SelD [Fulvivirga sedimenti]